MHESTTTRYPTNANFDISGSITSEVQKDSEFSI